MFRKVGRLRLRINMQTIHFSQGRFVEYGDNYYNFPDTTYIIDSYCRYCLMEGSLMSATYVARKSNQSSAHTGKAVIQEVFTMVI